MGESDGGVLLDVQVNPDDAAKEFDRLSKKAQGLEEKLAQGKQALEPVKQQAAQLKAQLAASKEEMNKLTVIQQAALMRFEAANTKLEEMRASGTATTDQIKQQAETVNGLRFPYERATRNVEQMGKTVAGLEGKYNTADQKVEQMTRNLENTNTALAATKEKAAQVAKEMGKGSPILDKMGTDAQNLEKRLMGLAKRVMIFSVFTAGLRTVRSWFADVIKTDEEAVTAVGQLKGALLTLVQPLVSMVIPAFTKFVQVLTQVISAIASVVASIFGTTVEESAAAAENLNDEKKALDGVGASAKKAGKSLASFDEINKLGGESSGGNGRASTSKEVAPDFSSLAGDDLSTIEAVVSGALLGLGAILTFSAANVPLGLGLMSAGAIGLAAVVKENWGSISQVMKGPLGALTAVVSGAVLAIGAVLAFSGANIPLGIGLMAMGAAGLATAIAANWEVMPDGVRMAVGLVTSVLSAALFALGGLLAFSGANIPLGIGLMAAGAAGLATAVAANWYTITQLLEGPLGAITGLLGGALLAIGGTLLFSGANIGLGLGLMAMGAVAFGTSLAANWDTITESLKGPVGVITGILSTALLVLGGILAFSGANTPLGIGLMVAGAVGLATSIAANWDSIVGPLGGTINAITAIVSAGMLVLGAILLFTGANMPLGLGLLIAGGIGLAASVAPNWNALLDALKGAWESVKAWWGSSVSRFLTKEYWLELGSNIINGLLGGLKKAFDAVKSWINDAVGWIAGKFGGAEKNVSGVANAVPQNTVSPSAVYSAVPSIQARDVPHLARGAVIPPNREFAAVLGDQTHGNNLEAPEGLIRQIVREEGGGNNAVILTVLQQILAAIKEGKVMVVDQTVFAQLVSSAMDSEDYRRGSPMVTVH